MLKIVKDKEYLSRVCESATYNQSVKIAMKMKRYLLENYPLGKGAVGLACNQLGLKGRVIFYVEKGLWKSLINPRIVKVEKSDSTLMKEGCLSFPNRYVKVKRYDEVLIEHQLLEGKKEFVVSGFLSRIIQHEIDHLNGITMYDREEQSNV